MTPYYADDWLSVYLGDCREVMAQMEPESVHCVVTSPPYWGLRDYGTAAWIGGDPDCAHGPMAAPRASRPASGLTGGKATVDAGTVMRGDCRCGAQRVDSQLGLEPTPEAYVESMVAVFREVRRVLRSDGTVWLNLGDSYAANMPAGTTGRKAGTPDWNAINDEVKPARIVPVGLKPKDLVGIPWRVAFALQADGWYLRSDIIWSKPNPMPESVTDRPTKAHEYLFLLSKSARYYFDADAVREPHIEAHLGRYGYNFWPDGTKEASGNGRPDAASNTGGMKASNPLGRNFRSVWNIATQPYPGAHFATFPAKLVEPCIKAGTSERGVCPECGAPWVREVEREGGWHTGNDGPKAAASYEARRPDSRGATSGLAQNGWREIDRKSTMIGWRPSCGHGCEHPQEWVDHIDIDVPPLCRKCGHAASQRRLGSAVILDPFAGSGTTGMVAQSLSRKAVLIDLSADYLRQLMGRNRDIPLGLESA